MSQLPNPGDLAYIVRDEPSCKENIGAVVLVCEDQTTHEGYLPADPGEVWCVASRPIACLDRDWKKMYSLPGERFTIYRTWLRKIAGPSVSTEVLRDEGVPA